MKTETKILIVAIIMILSIGPIDYFFSAAPKPLPQSNATSTVTSYSIAGNVSGTIMELKPYIYYVGIAKTNSKQLVESIIESIPDITNYSLEVSLNPYGGGYQYTIKVPVNDTTQVKRVGFRLAWRLNKFFEDLIGSIPFVQAKVILPESFSIPSEKGILNITTKHNQTVDAVLLYSKEPMQVVSLYCPALVTSLNYSLIKSQQLCDDNDLNVRQPYLGLSLLDVLTIPSVSKIMNLEATSITGVEFRGRYHFAGMESVSISGLESQTNSTIYLQPLENDSTQGNFTVKATYTDMATVNKIKEIFKSNNFTIEKEYKDAMVLLPKNVTIDGKYQEIYNIAYVTGQIAINDNPGFYNFNVTISYIFDEVTNVVAKKVNLS
jgi:hypothetical protein